MRRQFRWIAALGIACVPAAAQGVSSYTIQPFAGVPRNSSDNIPATAALLWSPHGATADRSGNVYIVDTSNNMLRRVTPAGIITTVTDKLQFPWKTAVGPSGDVYVADAANNRILRIATSGGVTTFAGMGPPGNAGDGGPAAAAQLSSPRDVAVDSKGNVFILDTGNNRVRVVTPDGKINAYAGTGSPGYWGDGGPAVKAMLSFPYAITVDNTGDLFIADSGNQRIRAVTPDGTIATIAGINAQGYNGDKMPALAAALNYPSGLALDAGGALYIADTGNNLVRKIDQPLTTSATITSIAGNGAPAYSGDGGPARSAQLNGPRGVSFDAQGNLLIADTDNNRVRKIDARGIITTIAGADHGSGDNGPALNARMFEPSGIAIDGTGNVYVSDTNNNRVRRIATNGAITNFAGNGSAGFSGDGGNATSAELNSPAGLTFDRSGALYIADSGNNVIRKVLNGVISTVAGNGTGGNDGDGKQATEAQFYHPSMVAFDRSGTMYIADSNNNRIRKVGTDGIVRHVAGEAKQGLPGYAGDGDMAETARLNYPRGLAIDPNGNIFIADFFNDRIRKIAAGSGIITTAAGTGVRGGAGEGIPATQAQLALPAGISFDSQGNLYIADSLNNRIRVLTSNGLLRSIAGAQGPGDAGDGGPALSAVMASPRDVAVDSQGVVYFTDQDNNRVRRLVPGLVSISAVVNAASGLPGGVAPGEIVTIYGTRMGPQNGVSVPGVSAGMIGNSLGGTRVLFDDVAAPLLYASNAQVSAIVPYEIAGRGVTRVVVESQGTRSEAFLTPVLAAAPGIFSMNSSGSGQGAILNQDGSLNGPKTPAHRGDIIVLYATGEGLTNPLGVTGQIAGDVLARPLLDVAVTIGGKVATIMYAGSAPQSAGLLQVNVSVPDDIAPGDAVPVTLSVGSFGAQPGITFAVR